MKNWIHKKIGMKLLMVILAVAINAVNKALGDPMDDATVNNITAALMAMLVGQGLSDLGGKIGGKKKDYRSE